MVPPVRSEASLSDPDHTRPALPDPQRDRHVSFPDDAPSADPVTPGPSLPPEAWAPRSSGPGPASPTPSSWQAPVPLVLTTPPIRRAPRRRLPGWAAFFLIPPLLLGLSSHNDATESYDCWSYDTSADPGTPGCDGTMDGTLDGTSGGSADAPGSVIGVYARDVTSSTAFAPMLGGTPEVSPVPADASSLTVEVVSTASSPSAGLVAGVDITSGGVVLDGHQGLGPYAARITLDSRPPELQVTATVVTGPGTIQCRVYAGRTLVAVDTSDHQAICSLAL